MDGQSYLLLIRDEGGPPELQVMLVSGPPLCIVPLSGGVPLGPSKAVGLGRGAHQDLLVFPV